MTDDSHSRAKYLPDVELQTALSRTQIRGGHWRLSSTQLQALFRVPALLPAAATPREFLCQLAFLIGSALGGKAALAGERQGSWVVAAESTSAPSLSDVVNSRSLAWHQVTASLGLGVDVWRADNRDWTVLGLSAAPETTVVLLLEGDWTGSASDLIALARELRSASRGGRAPWALDAVVRRLTRTLADTTGLTAVGETALQSVVQAIPSRIASLAVETAEDELSIVATLGYPLALVDHLRIAPGSGVIGSVFQSRRSQVVADVHECAGLARQRARYLTNSFVAIPVLAGGDALGVLSLTDRCDGHAFTHEDAAAMSVLMAPVALALGRERVLREAQAYAQAAVIDPVSGLFNRRYFQARLEEELHRAIRQQTSVGLLMVDVDGFKNVNDRFGHLAGDMVIRDMSEILRRSVRIFDVCTRFGGEEFAVMMPGGTLESAVAIAERIRHRVEGYQRNEPDFAGLGVTVSIGVAVSPPDLTSKELIERADRALYHAKSGGKNRVSVSPADGEPPHFSRWETGSGSPRGAANG